MNVPWQYLITILISLQGLVLAGDFCYSSSGYEYCRNGCCGDYNSPCCNSAVAAIVGGVIGGILFISFIVLIVCCCIRRSRGQQGTVIGANQGMVVNTVQTGTYPQTAPVVYPQPMVGGVYPSQPVVGGPYQAQPPPYQPHAYTSPPAYQPGSQQSYSNAGFNPDNSGNQTDNKLQASAPPY